MYVCVHISERMLTMLWKTQGEPSGADDFLPILVAFLFTPCFIPP